MAMFSGITLDLAGKQMDRQAAIRSRERNACDVREIGDQRRRSAAGFAGPETGDVCHGHCPTASP